ncbi:unnamed protein product [Oikopleura dioica]|uniref:Uncharacterized protein n=1 Tax=Oikopleura dioica TaxID=34765 RepID=E4XBT9_OIKDI|nr:unnamed protein product [Oikopleura dioica]
MQYVLSTWTDVCNDCIRCLPCTTCVACLKGSCHKFVHCNKCTFCLSCLKNPSRSDCWNCLQCRPCSLAIGCSPSAKAFGKIVFGTNDQTKKGFNFFKSIQL